MTDQECVPGVYVLLRNGSKFFSGEIVARYASRHSNDIRVVVENRQGLTYITEPSRLERLSYPADKTVKKVLAEGGNH